jgi:DNA-binding response OmpR family regulator
VFAHDGKKGLEKARHEKPGMIILDVMMPAMKGYDAFVVMKSEPNLKMMPVILLTGVDKAFFQTAYAKHMRLMTEADDYIAKPGSAEELVERVTDFLGKAQAVHVN